MVSYYHRLVLRRTETKMISVSELHRIKVRYESAPHTKHD